ncbi:hypothetical protein RB2150_12026 [Rhodobacteraceae bacterium HTCC2150]|nr:hypothetical protein RB2150_12026 [Rhodobacteraceae bacterium HTCC2150]
MYGPAERLRIAESLSEIVVCLGKYDVIHRDFRPENIMIDADLNPILIDFEFAISLSNPKIHEDRKIRRNLKQIKNLGGNFQDDRFWWDDNVSLGKVFAALEIFPEAVATINTPKRNAAKKLVWVGRRNTRFDRVWVKINNFIRSRLKNKKT